MHAPPARATGGRNRGKNSVPDPYSPYLGADFLHYPATFMAGHDRQRQRRGPVEDREVRVADAAGRDPDEYIPRAEREGRHLFHHERLAKLVCDCGSHLYAPVLSRAQAKRSLGMVSEYSLTLEHSAMTGGGPEVAIARCCPLC